MPKIIIQEGTPKYESSSVPNELGREVPAFGASGRCHTFARLKVNLRISARPAT